MNWYRLTQLGQIRKRVNNELFSGIFAIFNLSVSIGTGINAVIREIRTGIYGRCGKGL